MFVVSKMNYFSIVFFYQPGVWIAGIFAFSIRGLGCYSGRMAERIWFVRFK